MIKVGRLYRQSLVGQVKEGVTDKDVFLISYSRLSGLKMNDLRKNLKQAGAKVYVTKNSLVRLALKELTHDRLSERISGQIALIWGGADSAEVSKVLVKFAQESEDVVLQGGLLQGSLLEKSDIKKLSELPPRGVLLSMFLAAIQSPLTRLAGALNAKTRDLLSVLKQLSEKKGGSENV